MLWRDFLAPYSQGGALFDSAFLERWGKEHWKPNAEDQKAAARLHTQIISRITTQPLGYLDGDEKTALDSVYALFGETRKLCDQHCDGRHFEVLAWHVLNTHVRPFTAKWHLQSKRGMLSALDTTDEFRAELEELQHRLKRFEIMLASLRDNEPSSVPPEKGDGESAREIPIPEEMEGVVKSEIPTVRGGISEAEANKINAAEAVAIQARRGEYKAVDANKEHTVALALSGGGIRSATFSLGVLVALARRGLLPQFDYLSTVSGGGYLGSFLTAFLNTPKPPPQPPPHPAPQSTAEPPPQPALDSEKKPKKPELGLRPTELPFLREGGEAEALRHIRHHSKYLASGSFADRLRMIAAQLYGMALNGIGVVILVALFAIGEFHIRQAHLVQSIWSKFAALLATMGAAPWIAELWQTPFRFFSALFVLWAVISLLLIRGGQAWQKVADTGLVLLGGILLTGFAWVGLGFSHQWVTGPHAWSIVSNKTLLAILGAIPAIASAFAAVAGKIFDKVKMVLGWLSLFAAPLFFFCIYLLIYKNADQISLPLLIALFVVAYFLLDINVTSPHRHYRKKLAEAYLIQPAKNWREDRPFDEAVELKLSDAGKETKRAPYHLINAALNVPGSKNPGMQGRLTDFFLFSPAFCGSPLTGYEETKNWERKDGHLDLGTAMAISGAAAAPQMGLGTRKRLTFWLALLNVRLGYWVRKPAKGAWRAWLSGGAPGLRFLVKEMRGSMDERAPWLYVSDGGHIENLGVYELLRRRCKYIVAIDGEQDARMTFAALTTLQRLAAIDLGAKIDINLDDLRLNEQGLSRSHFRFCRITYPTVPAQYGYLLYLKLSLTGNEGEFLRRYRLDEPAFPHHSTADQFFSEAQFEAYRSLGEHVGDKLFLRALVGKNLARTPAAGQPAIKVEDWFLELGKRLLEPLSSKS